MSISFRYNGVDFRFINENRYSKKVGHFYYRINNDDVENPFWILSDRVDELNFVFCFSAIYNSLQDCLKIANVTLEAYNRAILN